MIIFCILYGIISFRFHYWGEMITYLGMTLPMAAWSAITWLRNPSEENENEVAIRTLNKKHIIGLTISTVIVTGIFYYILAWLDTPKYYVQYPVYRDKFYCCISYYAAFFVLRCGICYEWYRADCTLGTCFSGDPAYIPVVVNFAIFLLNDMYGFVSWKKRELEHVWKMF